MKDIVLAPSRPRRLLAKLARMGERGMTTAEYAVGTVAVVGIGGVLIKIFTDPEFRDLIMGLITKIFSLITGSAGGGTTPVGAV